MHAYVEVRNSPIHRNGVFALRRIRKGQRIMEYVGQKITKDESERRSTETLERARKRPRHGAVYIFDLNDTYDLDGDIPQNIARFINHSCDPNAETIQEHDRIWIYALRDIQPGEELFFNYGYGLESYTDHPCRCGSPRCIGYILAEEHWPKLAAPAAPQQS